MTIEEVEAMSKGAGMKTFTTSPSTVTANYRCLYMCRNSQFTSLTASGTLKKATRISSKTSFAAGTVIFADVTKFKLKGGAILAIE
jgi:hypothetical protein